MDDRFTAPLWRHPGAAGWHFVTLPEDLTDALRALHGDRERAFASLGVKARVGDSVWRTSLFYDRKAASFLLPVKAEVRARERLEEGDPVTVELSVAPMAPGPG